MWTIFICVSAFTLSTVSSLQWGRCLKPAVVQNFNITQYMGKWYQHATYNTQYEGLEKCKFSNYTISNNSWGMNVIINVHNEKINLLTNQSEFLNGVAILERPFSREGKLCLTLYPQWWLPAKGPYWVLSTDYKTYSIVYSCRQQYFCFHSSSLWILTRNQTLTGNDTVTNIQKDLDVYNLKYTNFIKTDQSHCK